jgi:hypothetical protein
VSGKAVPPPWLLLSKIGGPKSSVVCAYSFFAGLLKNNLLNADTNPDSVDKYKKLY